MATTQQIIDAAKQLGELIAKHEATQKYTQAVKSLQEDTEAQRTLNDYNRHLQALSEKEAAGNPIEVEDKQKLQTLQNAVVRHPLLRDLQIVQMDYADLMRQVDQAITGQDQASDAAPQGAEATSPLVNPDLSS